MVMWEKDAFVTQMKPNDSNETIIDSDSDGVADEVDYFSNNANYTQTKAQLDAYSLDPYKSFAVGDIIRILQN